MFTFGWCVLIALWSVALCQGSVKQAVYIYEQEKEAIASEVKLSDVMGRVLFDQFLVKPMPISTATVYSELAENLTSSALHEAGQRDLIIKGNFTEGKVQIGNLLTIRYEQLIVTRWEHFLNKRLRLWLIGTGSSNWIKRCISSYDFDAFEIYAYDNGKWWYMGEEDQPLIPASVRTKISLITRKVDQISIQIFETEAGTQRIVKIDNYTRLYINSTSNQSYISVIGSRYPSLFGKLVKEDHIVCQYELRYWNKAIHINSSLIVLSRIGTSYVERYNFINNQLFFGSLDSNGYFHGMGRLLRQNGIFVGLHRSGMISGRAAAIQFQHKTAKKEIMIKMMRSKHYLWTIVSQGRLFRGVFQKNRKAVGIFRSKVAASIGYYRVASDDVRKRNNALTSQFGLTQFYKVTTGLILSSGTAMFHDSTLLYGVFKMFDQKFKGVLSPDEKLGRGNLRYTNGTIFYGSPYPLPGESGMGLLYEDYNNYYIGNLSDSQSPVYCSTKVKGVLYKGEVLQGLQHGYGREQVSPNQWKEGIFFKGKFINGISFDNGVITEGLVLEERHMTESTIMVKDGKVFRGRQNYQREYPLLDNNSTQRPSTKLQLGAGLQVEYRQSEL